MKISVTNAQVLISTLQAGVNAAMSKGEHEFDFLPVLQAADDAARDELARAIAESQSSSSDDVGDAAAVTSK